MFSCQSLQIDLIDEMNRSGAMEFVVPAVDSDTFFPIQASARRPRREL